MSATAHLRAHHEATLLADDLATLIRFIQDSGRIIFPATRATLSAEHLALFVPKESPEDDDELQLMLDAADLDDGADPAPDRWRAYHGEPRLPRWAACSIGGARFRGQVVDHDPLNAPNPLARVEPKLCKRLNADRTRLAAVCMVVSGVAPMDPVAVGVDDLGIDVRARFGIVRLPFQSAAPTPADAESRLNALFGPAQ